MKTIIARFEDMKKDPMAILEDGVSANKVEAALATIGIALRDSEGEFRALQDVMDELGMKWNSLTRNQQAYIATVAAGSRQQSRFLALMNNYDRTLDLITESQNSAGAAAQQYATYQDSIAAAQARLTASWENFYSKIVDNDLIKTAINGLSKLIDILSKIPPSITAIGVTIGALRLQKYLTDNNGILGVLKKTLSSGVKDAGKKSALDLITEFSNTSIKELTKQSPTIIGAFKHVGTGITGVLSSIVTSFAGVTKAVAAFVAANWKIMAVVGLVTAAITGINYLINKQKREYEEAVKKVKEYNEQYETLSNRTKTAKDLLKTYEELSSKISLTDEEQNILNSTIDELKELYPELIERTNDYGQAEIANIDVIKDRIKAEERLAKIQKSKALKAQTDILKKDQEEWKQEDIVGINATYAADYFEAKEQKNEAEQYIKNIPTSKLNTFRVSWGGSQSEKVTDFINNETYKRLSTYEQNETLKQAKNAVNEMIRFYKLGIDEVEILDWDTIKNTVDIISETVEGAPQRLAVANKEMEKAKENLEKINILSRAFNEIQYSDNNSIYTSQKILENQLRSMFDKMDINIWKQFLGDEIDINNPEELTKQIQEILDTVTEENSIDLINLFKDFEKDESKLEELINFFEVAGSESGVTFVKAFDEKLKEQLKNEKEKFKEYLINLGVNETMADIYSSKLELGEGQQRQNYIEEYGLDSLKKRSDFFKIPKEALDELEGNVAQAIQDGDLDGLESLPNIWAEKWGIMDNVAADIISYGATADAIEKMIEERANIAFENIGKTASQIFSKKDFSSVGVDEAIDYMGAFGGVDNFLKHAKMGDDGKFEIDIYGQRLMLQKQLNDQIAIYDGYISDIEKLGENITPEEKKQLEYWKKLREEAAKQGKNLSDIFDITKEIEGSAKDIKRVISEIEIPDGLGGVATENARALSTSIDIGKEYENIVGLAEKLEKQMKEVGQVDDDIVQELLSYGSAFTDFFIIDETDNSIKMALDGVVENYADAAQAIVDIASKRRLAELEIKKQEMLDEANLAEQKAAAYDDMARLLENYVAIVIDNDQEMSEEEIQRAKDSITHQIEEQSTKLENIESAYEGIQLAAQTMYDNLESYDIEYWKNLGPENIAGKMKEAYAQSKAIVASANLQPLKLLETGDKNEILKAAKTYKQAAEGLRGYAARLRAGAEKLKVIDPTVYEKLADKMEKAGKAGEKAGEAIAKAIADAADAIIKLNDLIDEVKKNLKDITVDYNPFTDLFEAWEHEWDYYYNIKRLLQQIDIQGQYIDNIISSDYATADQRIMAEQAKMGNILAKMAANDTYIEALRAGMSQTAVELMKDYGEYYKVDPTTGQLYQTDKNLNDINELMNERKEEIYNLQKLQNEKENDLALENAKLDALEEEKSAYEDILSTVESQLDKLKDNEDITADISGLEKQKVELEGKIKVTDKSIEDAKDKIRDMEDEIQEIEVDITLKDQDFQKLEDYVSDMEDKVSEYEEYWENLNSTIAEQQELLQNLAEMRQGYIDTAISTQQALYDAIVENYQDEINEKKKQYDYLKQLDDDYLKTIKDNISKERQAREDANKQKEYQKNVQRAQLLQMDTSGTYRNELANLNKEIENQRQDLYDDLVDKQVEALEKEIEKRHELYDQEVQALEERLAYYQENAIILWEMVNSIVAEGTEAMMATLENTTEYMNSSELAKDEQRKAWEYDVQKTFEGVHNNVIETLNSLVEAGNKFIIEKYPEVGNSLSEYQKVFDDASKAVNDYNSQLISSRTTLNDDTKKMTEVFQGVLDSFMTTWNDRTNEFTGYAKNWEDVTNALKEQTSKNLEELESLYDSQGRAIEGAIGSIQDYDESLRNASAEIYQDFIDERERYRNELESFISQVESDLSTAVSRAATAIEQAAADISINLGGNDINNNPTENNPEGNISGYEEEEEKYRITGQYRYTDENGETKTDTITAITKDKENAVNILLEQLKGMKLTHRWLSYTLESYGISRYAKGGLASFTGPAWLDGTKSNPERVLSPKQTKLFESMVSSLERTANNSNINSTFGSSYNIGDINTTIQVEKLDNDTDINKVARQVEDRIMKSIRNRVTVSVK